MTYSEVMAYLDGANVFGSILGLDTITALLKELGDPQDGLNVVHVAGTNGKGSTCAFLSSILREAGYRTGLYISPYIQRFSERVQVDGAEISEDDIARCLTRVIKAAQRIVLRGNAQPTVFELTTAMGFLYFAEKNCDVVVLEVGLGGRLDATNVVKAPLVSVIAHIGLDHTEVLGGTLPEIAAEKGGIIKAGRPVVLYAQTPEVEGTIRDICEKRGSPLRLADASSAKVREATPFGLLFDWGRFKELRTRLAGLHQVNNAVTALTAVDVLRENGFDISDEAVCSGLWEARFMGRLEPLNENPLVIVDGAHNPQGVETLCESLRAICPGTKLEFVMGVLADKDYAASIRLIAPLARRFYCVTPPIYRALPAERLAETIRSLTDVPAEAYAGMSEALAEAVGNAGEGAVCVFGSLYQVGLARACFGPGAEK